MNTCITCSGIIPENSTADAPRKFCSSKCQNRYYTLKRAGRLNELDPDFYYEYSCVICSTKFKEKQKWDFKYCSRACSLVGKSRLRTAASKLKSRGPCTNCGELFYSEDIKAKFCSRKCSIEGRRKLSLETLFCVQCCRSFESTRGNNFCSISCANSSRGLGKQPKRIRYNGPRLEGAPMLGLVRERGSLVGVVPVQSLLEVAQVMSFNEVRPKLQMAFDGGRSVEVITNTEPDRRYWGLRLLNGEI